MEEKPNRYKLTEYWGPKVLITWYLVFILVGLIFFEFPNGLIIPIMGTIMAVVSIPLTQHVLKFQKKNSGHMKRSLYDSAVFFFWAFGIFGTAFFFIGAMTSVFLSNETSSSFFFLSSSLFPLGVAIGASKQWEMRDVFKT